MKKGLLLKLLVLFIALCMSLAVFTACKDNDGNNDGNNDQESTANLHYQEINDKQEYAIIGLGLASDSDIVIPSTYNGLPVTEINNAAFNSNS